MKNIRKFFVASMVITALCAFVSLSAEISPTKIDAMIKKLLQTKIALATILSAPNLSERDASQAPNDIKIIRTDIQKIRDVLNVLIENQQNLLEDKKK